MIKWAITFTDYEGNEKTREYRFHLSKADLIEMEFSTPGGMQNLIDFIVEKEDLRRLTNLIKDIILNSYGELSEDGSRFVKVKNGHRLSEDFQQTEAYSELYMQLNSDENALTKFIEGVIPANLRQEIAARG